ncbi:MAG: J domain-containing protein [Armatimonadota bacterium]
MKRLDYYSILGVDREADSKKIREAFRVKVREVHPDKNPDDPLAHKKTVEIIEAYKVIGNEKRRKTYDLSIKINELSSRLQIEQCPVTRDVTYINPRLIRITATLILIAMIAAGFWFLNKEQDMVFKPVQAIIDTNPQPLVSNLVHPALYDCLDYYYTTRYTLGAGDYQSTMTLIGDYFELAKQARACGNIEKSKYYLDQIQNSFEDLKILYLHNSACKSDSMPL